MRRRTQKQRDGELRRSTASKLHARLTALGCDVYLPERIWIGRSTSIDRWRWQAGERISRGSTFIGSEDSMRDCLAMEDDELKLAISHSSGHRFFYRLYDEYAAACRKVKAKQAKAIVSPSGGERGYMIHNDDKVGNYVVTLIAVKKSVASFQTRTLADAQFEAERLRHIRKIGGLPTARMYARQIISNRVNGRWSLLLSDVEHEL